MPLITQLNRDLYYVVGPLNYRAQSKTHLISLDLFGSGFECVLPTSKIFIPLLTDKSPTAAAERFSDSPASFSCQLFLSLCRP